jgi:HSP20 family molecular chaperone IbpA
MNKSNKFLVAAIITINALPCINVRASADFVSMRDFFTEVDSLLFGDEVFGEVISSVDNVYSKDMEVTFVKIQQEARRIQAEALNAMRALHDTSSKRACETLKSTQKRMTEGVDSLKGLTAQLDDGIAQTQKMSQFSIKETEKDGAYIVKISLPGYSQDDIKVTVSKQDIAVGARTLLEVEAVEKKQTKSTTQSADKNDKSMRVITTQQLMSTSIINDRKREIRYKDGVLQAKVVLPHFVNDENYSMVFKDEILTLEFKKLGKSEQKKELKFSEDK